MRFCQKDFNIMNEKNNFTKIKQYLHKLTHAKEISTKDQKKT